MANTDRTRLTPGLWPSPFAPELCGSGTSLSDVMWDPAGEALVWLEGRSDVGVLVARGADDAAARDLTPTLSVRARVGYGGGDFTVCGGVAVFSSGGRLYRQALAGGGPRPITPAGAGAVASPTVSPDGRFVVYVHSAERRDSLAVVDADGEMWPQRLVSGEDFYMQPTWHPAGDRLAWVCWNYPHMPWDGTLLRVGRLDLSGPLPRIAESRTVAGGEDAILQPVFSPDGRRLLFASDKGGGFWNLYLCDLDGADEVALTHETDAEVGAPAWGQGERGHAFSADGRYVFYLRRHAGFTELWRVPASGGKAERVAGLDAYTSLNQLSAAAAADRLAVVASGPAVPPRILRLDGAASGNPTITVLRRSRAEIIPEDRHAWPEAIRFTSFDGAAAHGMLYRPTSTEAVADGPVPTVILVHGGPTGQATAAYQLQAQFLASRGYAVLDLNYRGSSGYGRAYRDALRGNWGIHDTEDAVFAGRHLADIGVADSSRLVVMGGSAGGYTVLRALTRHPGFFRAGVCLFGVSNLFTLAAETHKFEQRYLDSLVGPLPEAAAVYRDRSPIFSVDKITDPVAMFQGEDDNVVPKSQADTVVASLVRRGVPHVYHLYPGEGHGWRRLDTITHFYRSLDAFLRDHVVFA